MPLSLGRIPYLNTEPFFGEDNVRAATRVAPPRQMIDLVRGGQVDLAPLPVVASFDYPDEVTPVGALGIATQAAAKSVLLFSRMPPEDLGGRCIGVIDETATSARLLRVLLGLHYGVDRWQPVPLEASAYDACLLIGDRALTQSSDDLGYDHVIDLATAWHAWTGLPFVFAAWMQREGAVATEVSQAMEYLDQQLSLNLTDLGLLASRRPDLGMDASDVGAYLATFEYRFAPDTWEALQQFRELDAQVNMRAPVS